MYSLKKHSWQMLGLATTLLLSSCALIAPPGDGTEEDPYIRNTEGTTETGDYPSPTGDYSSPTDTTVGYPPPATGGEYSVPPPMTDIYTPPATGTYPPPSTTPYYPPPSNPIGGSGTYHTVQPGENLYRISKNYGLRYQDVAASNNIPPPYTVSVGQRILVRGGSAAAMPSAPASTASYHTVQRGENLYRISLKYGCTVADIASWNGLSSSDYSNLSVGQRLRVSATGSAPSSRPAAAPPRTSTPATSSSNFHVVGPTETLTTIANSYGLTVYELALWNGISSPYTVYPGQRLLIVPP